MAFSVNTKPENTGDKTEFQGSPPSIAGNEKDVNFAAVAPDHMPWVDGKDTYEGLPGDGVVPG